MSGRDKGQRTKDKGQRKVRCRVCKTPVNQQNYRVHLLRKHEDEDPNDLREFGQQRMFGQKRKLSVTDDVSLEETVDIDKDEDVYEVEDTDKEVTEGQ